MLTDNIPQNASNLKYLTTRVVFREVPDEITLAINITNCPFMCEDCHSPELHENTGRFLNKKEIDNLLDRNKGITCVSLMGGDSHPEEVLCLARYIKTMKLKSCWYTGQDINPAMPGLNNYLDFIKTGPYIKERGPLDNPNTNQRFYELGTDCVKDLTNRFTRNL